MNAERKELPDGWKWVKLGDVIAHVQPGFACGKRDDSGVVQVRMNNVSTTGKFMWQNLTRIPSDFKDMSRYWLEPNDVLFNNTNSAELVGKSAIFQGFEEQVVYSNHFSRLIPNHEILYSGYLANWLMNTWTNGTFARICNRWVGQAAVPKSMLLAMDFPIPSLEEQIRIAATVDERMDAVEKARKAAEEVLEAVDALRGAILRELLPYLGQQLADGWKFVKLGDVCEINPRRPRGLQWHPETMTTFVPMSSVDEQIGVISNPIERRYAEVSRGYTYFEEGDVLFAKITPCMQNGKHAIASCLLNKFGFGSTEFHVIRPSKEIIPTWIHGILRQKAVLKDAERYFRGTAGQQRVPKEFLMDLQIPLAPLEEQKRITDIVASRIAKQEQAQAAALEQLNAVESLRTSILHDAFNGAV